MTDRVTIERLGQKGEGIAGTPDGRLYVPYALPQETVTVERVGERGTMIGLLRASPDRVEACCPAFTRCGGCAVQTLAQAPYAEWKRGLLVTALAHAGLTDPVAPLLDAHGAGRRRATFHARPLGDGRTEVGYMRARAHTIIPIDSCPILAPGMAGALPAARSLAQALAGTGKPLDILVTATDTGLDIDLRGPGKLDEANRQRLVEAALAHDVARVSNHGVIVLERRRPLLKMGAAVLEPPPGTFLQATEAGEAALATHVLDAFMGVKLGADLFAGVGTFALRLAAQADMVAYDTERGALEALSKASRPTQLRTADGLRPVAIEPRDLFNRPLQPDELARYDAVVLDPPRAGAEAQMRALAKSGVPLVVSIACDVQSFARDAAILVAAGFRPETILPIDQFRFSAHLEIFSVFRRAVVRKKRRLLG